MNVDTKMKGDVVHVERYRNIVRLWVSSPTGDASDSHMFEIDCYSTGQAKLVASKWRKVWGLNEVSEDNQ